jgi:hypothetical protein
MVLLGPWMAMLLLFFCQLLYFIVVIVSSHVIDLSCVIDLLHVIHYLSGAHPRVSILFALVI